MVQVLSLILALIIITCVCVARAIIDAGEKLTQEEKYKIELEWSKFSNPAHISQSMQSQQVDMFPKEIQKNTLSLAY